MATITDKQIKYLALTDFDLIVKSMALQLSPIQFRIINFLNSCLQEENLKMGLDEAAACVGLDSYQLILEIKVLEYQGLVHPVSFKSVEDQT